MSYPRPGCCSPGPAGVLPHTGLGRRTRSREASFALVARRSAGKDRTTPARGVRKGVVATVVSPVDPTAAGFLLAENRSMPMHVGGLQLFRKPEGAGPDYVREMYLAMRDVEEVAPLFLKHPHRSVKTAGQLVWREDEQFDIEHHVRHSALPQPGRVRELLELCSRLHSTRLAWERPLWEAHVIEGMADGRVAMYTKTHHALVDGVSAMRLLQSVLTTDPDQRGMPAPWAARPRPSEAPSDPGGSSDSGATATAPATGGAVSPADLPLEAFRTAMGITAEAAGLPAALVRTLTRSVRNETSALSLYAPRTILNRTITGSRRFAAQDWPVERLRAIGKATGTTLNDVVLAMCSGALRSYLDELNALPDAPLVAMVPVGLKAKESQLPSLEGGNAVGAVMVQLGTNLADPAQRLATVHRSMLDGKEALSSMTPIQILAMSAIGQAPAILTPLFRMQGLVRPPYNTIISNVPGPRTTHYWNGAELLGTYPLSIPINGMALNITCTSYDGKMCFGLTGCRRTLPHLQRLLAFLDDEVAALEKAADL
ncbi:wax ester/triacylglycerol synthase family O-acyltransferase [Nocardioides sp. GCM10027113]|uniref:WS/DGAT/MGAT family O-acyltransferase n=1 Tax=unclassified Nocardioides TaxID=2615069 RepID=UPI003618D56D